MAAVAIAAAAAAICCIGLTGGPFALEDTRGLCFSAVVALEVARVATGGRFILEPLADDIDEGLFVFTIVIFVTFKRDANDLCAV